MTRNQYYGGMNRRFDKRAALLRRFGFAYRIVPIPRNEHDTSPPTIAVFVRARGAPSIVPAATVAHADKHAWTDELGRLLARA